MRPARQRSSGHAPCGILPAIMQFPTSSLGRRGGAVICLLLGIAAAAQAQPGERYENFNAAVYARVFEVQQMADPERLESRFDQIARNVRVGKIYLETHRDKTLADAATLEKAKAFFETRGVEVAGGITLTISEPNRFETFCYSDPKDRAWVQQVVEFTARHFDEIILDDFFFTSCKNEIEIQARGDRSWTEYRTELLGKAANELILGPARAVNPRVKVVVKYPNWYEHFQGLGFNLETEPGDFDGIYTGTETRDAVRSAQHLQPYHGFQVFRYFENLSPGRNRGGWVDTAGSPTLDRYAEQLWLTLFAKAPEITLFDFRQLQSPISDRLRAPWQGRETSFDYDAMMADYARRAGPGGAAPTFAVAAGFALDRVDSLVGGLGRPIGVASYRPFHSTGEDFLHNYLGMVGIPIDLRSAFPDDARTVLLTEDAAADPDIVGKIDVHLRAGGSVVITSGLLGVLGDRGIGRIAEIQLTSRKALVSEFQTGGFGPLVTADAPILIPQIEYLTNDSWELVSALSGPNGWPMLHAADYGRGHLYVLTVPDNFAELYRLPEAVLNAFRQTIAQDLFVRIDAPSSVALIPYDNDTFIVESFRDEPAAITILTDADHGAVEDLESHAALASQPAGRGAGFQRANADAGRHRFAVTLEPHSFRAFRSR
jgi:hypothetical protein